MSSSSGQKPHRLNKGSKTRSTKASHSTPASPSSLALSHTNTSKTSSTSSKASVLLLKQNHVSFEAPSHKVSVFFDECNREVISLTSGFSRPGADRGQKTRVVFQATDDKSIFDKIEFLLPVEKRVLSIKLNSSRTVLAYHIEKSNIEFVNVSHLRDDVTGAISFRLDDRKYIQPSRAKNSKLFGFLWTGPMQLVMITDISIEYYHVDSHRFRLRHIKSFSSSTNWFVYQPSAQQSGTASYESGDFLESDSYSVLMVSTGSIGNSMQPYMFNRGQVMKLERFDVEGRWQGSEKLELFERSITIASIYDRVRLLVLQHESLNVKSRGAQILVYTIDPETGLTTKTHTLDLDVSGRFAINIFDNLVVVHDQPSKSSFIYDILIDSTEKSDCPKHFVSLIDSQPIRPLKLHGTNQEVELYSLNWVFFQPNFIIDAKLGMLSTLYVDLEAMRILIQDNLLLLNFLSLRRNSETIILNKCTEIVLNSLKMVTSSHVPTGSPLAEVSATFEIISRLIISTPELERKPSTATGSRRKVESGRINQEDLHHEVFRKLEDKTNQSQAHTHFIISALLEFIFSVRRQEKNVDFCIYEQLLRVLVNGKRFYQIIQMIRSDIFKDSKQLACLLLTLRDKYKPATQLAIDMLRRLDCLSDLIESLSLDPEPQGSVETESRLSTSATDKSLEINTVN